LAEASVSAHTVVSIVTAAGEKRNITIPCAANPAIILSETTAPSDGTADKVKGKLTLAARLERMRVNAPLWAEIEKSITAHCRSQYSQAFKDVFAGTREAFLAYNNRPDGSKEGHIAFARKSAQKAYKKFDPTPRRKQSNSNSDELEEYGTNLRLVSYEYLQETTGYEVADTRHTEMDERLEALLGSSVVPKKFKQIMNLSLQGESDATIGTVLGCSRVRVTQMKKELRNIYLNGV